MNPIPVHQPPLPNRRAPTRGWQPALMGALLAVLLATAPEGVLAQATSAPDAPPVPLAAADAVRFHALTQELRCVVCQNENLADSTAPLAQDLKREIREQMLAGRSDDDIKAFLVARYGDFVTYRPPVRVGTLLLWGGPLVFVLVAGGLWVRNRAAVREPVQPVDKSFGDNA